METVTQYEKIDAKVVRQGIANGVVVIPANINHTNLTPGSIGQGLKTKVNANIDTSSDYVSVDTELEKLRAANES